MQKVFSFWYDYSEALSSVFCLIVGLVHYKKLQKLDVFFLKYIFVHVIINLIIVYRGTYLHIYNNFAYHLSTPVSLVFLLWFCSKHTFIHRYVFRIIASLFLIICIINCFYIDTIVYYNSFTESIAQIIALIVCLVSLLKLAVIELTVPFYKLSYFWILTGFLCYAIINCMSSVFYAAFKTDLEMARQIWPIKLVGNDIKFLFFTIAFLCTNNK